MKNSTKYNVIPAIIQLFLDSHASNLAGKGATIPVRVITLIITEELESLLHMGSREAYICMSRDPPGSQEMMLS